MTPLKEIGECLITAGTMDFFFRPSFINMSRIGEPQQIVQAFYDLHNDEVMPRLNALIENYASIPERQRRFYAGYTGNDLAPGFAVTALASMKFSKAAIMAAMAVMTACCEDDVSTLTGEIIPGKSGKWTFVYRKGLMSPGEMVLIAQSLITHGIIGKAKVRQLQRHESGMATTEFNAFEYISAARNHFNMSRGEAEQLSMTEFQLLLAAKYPDQKGLTRDEYDAVADDYFAKKARKLAKEARLNQSRQTA